MKLFKKLSIVVASLFCTGLLSASSLPPEDTTTPPTTDIEETQLPCNVTISKTNGGEIYVDLLEGEVGDIVTVHVQSDVFYVLQSITANGINLVANTNGNYQFPLVEGENVINVKFVLNEEVFNTIENIIASVGEDGDWTKLLTLENLGTLLLWVFNGVITSGLLITFIKSKKKSNQAQNDTEKIVAKILMPVTDKLSLGLDEVNATVKTLVRCFILSQENTPEARLAIIEEMSKLKASTTNLTEEVKAIIQKEIKLNLEEKKEQQKTLEELKETNDNINTNTEGRY